jgi:FMN-dependent NADH-azoreductase
MTTILEITSSPRGPASRSTLLADELTAHLAGSSPGARVVKRDLAADPVRLLDLQALTALGTDAAERTADQRALVADHDALIAEVQAADVIVLGVPMYNFAVPVQLKAYLDAITRKGVTFRYTDRGPEGLLRNKKVYAVLARGGRHRGTAADSQTPYLQTILGFLGLRDVEYVYAEGLDMGPASQQAALAAARQTIAAIQARPSPARPSIAALREDQAVAAGRQLDR